MKSMKRIIAIMCILCLTAVMFAGCASKQSAATPTDTTAGTATVTSTAAAEVKTVEEAKPVTLRMSWWGSEARHEATLNAIKLYSEKNTNVTIDAEFQGFDGYEDKLATQIAGGTTPDIMQITSTRMMEFAERNDIFADFNAYSSLIDLSGFDAKFLDNFGKYNGALIGLPTGVNSRTMFFNTKLCDAAGVKLADKYTWDEFISEGAKINKANPDQYMFIASSDDWFQLLLTYYRQKTGSWPVSDDNKVELDMDAITEAYAFIKKMYDEKVVEPVETSYVYNSSQAENKKWIKGDIGSVFFTASSYNQFACENVTLLGKNPPQLPDAKTTGIQTQPSQVFSVTKNESVEESVKFLNYLYNEDEGILTLGDVRSVPPVQKARELLANNNKLNPIISSAVDIALSATDIPMSPVMQNSELQRANYAIIDKLAYATITPEEAAKQTLAEYQRVVDSLAAAK